MPIAIIGSAGQLGRELCRQLGDEALPLAHSDIDITDPQRTSDVLRARPPGAVINAAAYNLVDKAEDEPDVAYRVNSLGPRNLALVCRDLGVPLLHVSSDYVFGLDATRSAPFHEDDPPGPVSAYGLSKLAGEYFVRAASSANFVVRTCGLYGQIGTKGKGNFVETMLRLGRERPELTVVDDQRCTPTAVADLAPALIDLLRSGRPGLYHATNSGSMTWCEFAREILQQAGIHTPVRPITSAQFAAKARRPPFSVLDCTRLASVIGRRLPDWRDALGRYLRER